MNEEIERFKNISNFLIKCEEPPINFRDANCCLESQSK